MCSYWGACFSRFRIKCPLCLCEERRMFNHFRLIIIIDSCCGQSVAPREQCLNFYGTTPMISIPNFYFCSSTHCLLGSRRDHAQQHNKPHVLAPSETKILNIFRKCTKSSYSTSCGRKLDKRLCNKLHYQYNNYHQQELL